MREAARIAKRVLERDVAAERMAQHRPVLEPEPLAQRVGVGGQVLPGHRCDGRAGRAPVAAVVVEDQGELIREPSERQHRVVIGARAAVHEQQRVAMPDHLDIEGHVAYPESGHRLLPSGAVRSRRGRGRPKSAS